MAKRNIGSEILKGIRQLKRGQKGRVITTKVAPNRSKTRRPGARSSR